MLAVFSFPSLQNGVDDTLLCQMAQKEGGSMCSAVSAGEGGEDTCGWSCWVKQACENSSHLHFISYPRLPKHLLS